MSITFDRFLAQYRSSGREKLDGYDRGHFDGMTHDESVTAERMLVRDSLDQDVAAIRGLGVLGSLNAMITLQQLLSTTQQPSWLHLEIANALWQATQNTRYQEIMIDYLSNTDDELRKTAANNLRFTTPNKRLFQAFWTLLQTENHPRIRATAVRSILLCVGLTVDPYDTAQNYLNIVRGLVSKDSDARQAALNEARTLAASSL